MKTPAEIHDDPIIYVINWCGAILSARRSVATRLGVPLDDQYATEAEAIDAARQEPLEVEVS